MNKHTAGPWEVVGSEIWGPRVKIASGRGSYDEKDRKRREANARLIAAAPDMLEALIACYNHIKNDMTVRGIGMNARRAIESATGENIEDLTFGHIIQGET